MDEKLSPIKDEYIHCIKAWQPYYEPEPYKENTQKLNEVVENFFECMKNKYE